MSDRTTIHIKIEFTGGLETLFHNKKNLALDLPASNLDSAPYTVGDLIKHLDQDYVQKDKRELFILDGTVRPGILVLINDADWELEGEADYELKSGDNIIFVSTLHGG